MRLRVKKLFKYTWDNITTHKLLPGEYDVPAEVAENTALLAIQFGAAVWINIPKPAPKKEAPENKVFKEAAFLTGDVGLENKVGPLVIPESKAPKTTRKRKKKKATRKR
jgi:hypothetical protein